MAADEKYLIPLDNNNFTKSVITEELMNHIVHGRQKDVMAYDFTELEAEGRRLHDNF